MNHDAKKSDKEISIETVDALDILVIIIEESYRPHEEAGIEWFDSFTAKQWEGQLQHVCGMEWRTRRLGRLYEVHRQP